MLRLDSVTSVLQAVLAGAITTTQPQATVCFSDDVATAATYTGGKQVTVLNSTTDVTICAAPAAATVRDIDFVSVVNRDTASITLTVKFDISGADSTIIRVTLLTLEQLYYTHSDGWKVIAADGSIKTSSSGGSSSPTGPAGGDLTGTYPNPTVSRINGVALGSTVAASGNMLIADGTSWVSRSISGDLTISSLGVATIPAGSISLDELSDVVITAPATGATLIFDGVNWIDGALNLADTDAVTGTLSQANGGTGNITGSPSGPAGGDLTGTYPNPTIANGAIALDELSDVVITSPATGATLIFDGVNWIDEVLGITGVNLLVNPGFLVDQIGYGSATAQADDTYSLDCWYTLTQTASINVTRQTDQENGTPSNIRLTQSQASAQRMGLAQIIESASCRDVRGNAVTESLRVRISNSQAVRYAILEWTGTADTVTSDVVNNWTSGAYTAGNFFLAANLVVTAVGSITPAANTWTDVTALTGTCGSSTNNLIVLVWTEGTAAQNVTLDVGRFKLEFGSLATVYHDTDYPTEFNKCSRYFKRIGGNTSARYGAARTTSTAASELIMYLPIPMRVAPVITVNNPTSWSTNDASVNAAWITVASTLTSTDTVNINVSNALVVAFRPAFMTPNNANGTIDMDARL